MANLPDRGPALLAGFAFAPVHQNGLLVTPDIALGAGKIAQGAAAAVQRLRQYLANGGVQPGRTWFADAVGGRGGADTRQKQGFAGVNIANPYHRMAGQQHGLNGRMVALQGGVQNNGREGGFQRLRPQPIEQLARHRVVQGLRIHHGTKAARVVQAHAALIGDQVEMVVRAGRWQLGQTLDAARHAQVQQQHTRIQRKHHVFTAAVDRHNALPHQGAGVAAQWPTQRFAQPQLRNAGTHQRLGNPAAGDFNFGQFGHSGRQRVEQDGLDYYGLMFPFPRLFATALLVAHASAGSAWAQAGAADRTAQLVNDRVVFYEMLVSEFSAQAGELPTAFSYMLDAAQRAKSERLFERAVELGFAQRNAIDALQAAQAWAKTQPTSAQAYRYTAQILIGLDRLPEAVEPLRRMLQSSSPAERATHLSLLPNYFARVKDRNQAAQTVQQVLASELNNSTTGPAAWAAIARMQAFAGNDSQAQAALEKASALDPHSDEAALAALQIGGKTAQDAQALLQKRLQNKPGTALRMATMRSLIDSQNYAAAYEQLQRLTQESPDYAEAWLVKGSLELQNDQVDTAQASLETFLKLSPPPAAPADAATASSEVTPRSTVEALLLLATIAERKKNFPQADAYLDSIYSPAHQARVLMRRASLAAAQGQLEQARALLRDIPANSAETLRARYSAELQLLRERKLHAQALELAQEAAQALPQEPVWRYEQAMLAEKLGRLADMEALLRGLIASHPQYHPPYNALGYSLADRSVALDEARQLLTKALEFAPDDAYIVDSMGWLEFRSGNLAQARQLLEKAFQAQPDAEIAAHLGEVLWKLGDTERAQALWKEGLKLNALNATLLETMGRFHVKP